MPAVRALVRCALPVLLLVAAAGGALAQTPTRDRPFPEIDGARRWGPFLVDLDFLIENVGYDDNVFLVPADDPNRRTAWTARVGPEIRAQSHFGRRIVLTLHDKLVREVFFGVDGIDANNNEFDGRLDVLLGPVLLSTEGSWATTRQRPLSELDQRVRLRRTAARQTAYLFLGGRTDLVASAEVERLRYSDPDLGARFFVDPDGDGTVLGGNQGVTIGTALDRDRIELAGELGWRPRGRTRLFARWESRDHDFLSDAVQRDSEDRRLSVGLEFRPQASISGRVAVGRARLENVDDTLANKPAPYDGTVVQGRLVLRPTGRGRITLLGERDVRFSTFERNLYYVLDRRSIAVDWFLGRWLGVQFGADRRDLNWPERTTVARDAAGRTGFLREDRIDDVYGGFLIQLRSGLMLGLRFGRRVRESNLPAADDEQNYWSTTGSFRF
ncbi:MAG: hypothetical protein Kow0062_06330 [Acidobacteriota bacterium]